MKPRLVGINHVALQVDDIEEAVAFYTDLFQPYDQQFTKTDRVLAGMSLQLGKSESALDELRAKDLAD